MLPGKHAFEGDPWPADKDLDFCKTVLSQCNIPVLITTSARQDFAIIYVNQAFEAVTGYASKEVIGRNCRFLQNRDINQPAVKAISEAIREGRTCEEVLRNYRRDGQMFWNRLYLFPLKDRDGNLTNYVGIQHDVTHSHITSLHLKEKQHVLENSLDVFLKVDQNGRIVEANRAVASVFGWTPEELVHNNIESLLPDERVREAHGKIIAHMAQTRPQILTGEYKRKDGSRATVEWVLLPGAANTALLCVGRDITEKRRAELEIKEAHERVLAIMNSITEGCFSIDRDWRFTYVNPQGAKWLMKEPDQIMGKPLLDVFPEAVDSVFYETYRRAMESNVFDECEAYFAPLGKWFNARVYPSALGLTVFFVDISERKRNEESLVYAATHDHLTTLINRTECIRTLRQKFDEAPAGGKKPGVLFIDLDKFKEVNDALGHQAGDRVLACIGKRLSNLSGPNSIPARISGDEFLFIFLNMDEEQAMTFARQVIDVISMRIELDDAEVTVGASVGIAIADDEPMTPDELINRADSAMYKAKDSGRHTAVLYSPGMALWEKRQLQLRHQFLPALRAGQFELFYQPQCRLADDHVTGAEALIRWRHPQYGLLTPDVFLQIAEESALILETGSWVIEEACRQAAEWKRGGFPLTISVNVSTRQLNDRNLPVLLAESVRRYGLSPSDIKIELTESMLAQDFATAAEILGELKEKGFSIALDDFGTGYSNLAYIKRFPITAIKIDRSFVIELGPDDSALELINGIVALAKSMTLSAIVEGVETEQQRQVLRTTGCDTIQGYLTGKPAAADDFLKLYLRRGA